MSSRRVIQTYFENSGFCPDHTWYDISFFSFMPSPLYSGLYTLGGQPSLGESNFTWFSHLDSLVGLTWPKIDHEFKMQTTDVTIMGIFREAESTDVGGSINIVCLDNIGIERTHERRCGVFMVFTTSPQMQKLENSIFHLIK